MAKQLIKIGDLSELHELIDTMPEFYPDLKLENNISANRYSDSTSKFKSLHYDIEFEKIIVQWEVNFTEAKKEVLFIETYDVTKEEKQFYFDLLKIVRNHIR